MASTVISLHKKKLLEKFLPAKWKGETPAKLKKTWFGLTQTKPKAKKAKKSKKKAAKRRYPDWKEIGRVVKLRPSWSYELAWSYFDRKQKRDFFRSLKGKKLSLEIPKKTWARIERLAARLAHVGIVQRSNQAHLKSVIVALLNYSLDVQSVN